MSRVGKVPIPVPKEVKTQIQKATLTVEGKKGKLSLEIPPALTIESKEGQIAVTRRDDEKLSKSLHGTFRALIRNMIIGVSEGFKKELEIVGVGYKTQMKGNTLVMNIGFSHPVEVPVPKDLKVSTPKPTRILVEGTDKQRVGELAAQIRRNYPPEPYKGKGIRYAGEEIKKKLGKALAK
ncbi:MAG: 50S ribosomal protein L6 [Candidatus Omnitrophica bacterium]|nr:50S ribosomal protein L6 [Candidatus Omnitrophota bacterium]